MTVTGTAECSSVWLYLLKYAEKGNSNFVVILPNAN